jgi:hypothetical protein
MAFSLLFERFHFDSLVKTGYLDLRMGHAMVALALFLV